MGASPKKRKVDLVVISDVHLGTSGCKARELFRYLKSIQPKTLILNGDIIDGWQFKKSFFPKHHTLVLKQVLSIMAKGAKVYYVTGNHDELMRKFVGFKLGNFKIVNKVVLRLRGKRAWVFHGDVFDVVMEHSKWLAKLGSIGYDLLLWLNKTINWGLNAMGKEPYSFSKKIKASVKGAVKFINNFEETAARIAIDNGYDYVVCGHIHTPEMRKINNENGEVMYLNSGDWVESLTGLEYNEGEWSIYSYMDDELAKKTSIEKEEEGELDHKKLFKKLAEDVIPDVRIDSV